MKRRVFTLVCLAASMHAQAATLWAQTQEQRPAEQALVIPEGTNIQLSLREPLSSKLSETGDEVIAVVRRDVVVDGQRLLREGTEVIGRVTLAQPAGRLLKGGKLHVTFDRIRLDGGERRLSVIIKSASDFTRDEKVKGDGEGTLKGGASGGNVLQNVGTAAGIGMIGVTIIILSSIDGNNGGLLGGGIGRGAGIAGASVLGGSVVAGLLLTKGKEVRLDQNTVVRLQIARPLAIE